MEDDIPNFPKKPNNWKDIIKKIQQFFLLHNITWKKVGIFIGILLLILIIGVVCAFSYFMNRINKQANYQVPTATEEIIEESPLVEEEDEELCLSYRLQNIDFGFIKLKQEEQYTNILLIGQDSRSTYMGLSDSLIILTIDKAHNKIKLTSLMRDLYVSIPGKGNGKLNAALPYGGTDLLFETIEQNMGISLDSYILIDFEGFKKAIDLIGGVEIEVNQRDYNYLKTTNYIDDIASRNALTVGLQTLNGSQALGYARIRKVGNNDFERTQRQRTILMSAFNKMKTQSLTSLLTVANDCLPYITTNIDTKTLLSFIPLVLDMGNVTIEDYRLPVDGTYNATTIGGASVIVCDFEENVKKFYQFLYEDDYEEEQTQEEEGETETEGQEEETAVVK